MHTRALRLAGHRADNNEKVIDQLGRVTRVSAETGAIIEASKDLNRGEWDATGER